ncbi:MAG: hypothetical protein ACFE9Q_11300 [Candidatus Hodarchaeota archaeon]
MEDMAWKRDKTPYLVFPCMKCKQYTYVRTTQKTKKCVRCGHSHIVIKILENGEIVKGISSAVESVKRRQNELALEELGNYPEFRASNDYKIDNLVKSHKKIIEEDNDNENYAKFKKLIIELSELYREFPYYVIEVMAEKYGIPDSEVKLLTRNFLNQGILLQIEESLFKLNQ